MAVASRPASTTRKPMQAHDEQVHRRVAELEARLRFTTRLWGGAIVLCLVGVSTLVAAQTKGTRDELHVFVAGEPARAAEVNDNFRLVLEKAETAAPPGTIVAYGGIVVPPGWLLCDGAEVAAEEYPELAGAIGVTWGAASSGHIRLPDLQNWFLRGAAQDDPVGREQGFALEGMTGELPGVVVNSHNIVPSGVFSWERSAGGDANAAGTADAQVNITFDPAAAGISVADETRPKNKAVHYIIKY
ncbi:MAG: tail fiber protein [Myxococcales bacterium FL481]|nr:MAG: tail fiber protein [Myxococcales bacterium FL481]